MHKQPKKIIMIDGYLTKGSSKNFLLTFFNNLLCLRESDANKKQWKKYFCTLYKIQYNTETEVFFEYYKNQTLKRFKGFVDLSSCTNIISFQDPKNVFSIITKYNDKEKIYYFSAESLANMNEWVEKLANVLHLEVDTSHEESNNNPCHINHDRFTTKPLNTHKLQPLPHIINRAHDVDDYQLQIQDEVIDEDEYHTDINAPTDCDYQTTMPKHGYVNVASNLNLNTNAEDISVDSSPHQTGFDANSLITNKAPEQYSNLWEAEVLNKPSETKIVNTNNFPCTRIFRRSLLLMNDNYSLFSNAKQPLESSQNFVNNCAKGEILSERFSDSFTDGNISPNTTVNNPSSTDDAIENIEYCSSVLPVRVPREHADSSSSSSSSSSDVDNCLLTSSQPSPKQKRVTEKISSSSTNQVDAEKANQTYNKIINNSKVTPIIDYIEVNRLDFPNAKKYPPVVPPRPLYLRSRVSNSKLGTDFGSEQIVYNEINHYESDALALLMKPV